MDHKRHYHRLRLSDAELERLLEALDAFLPFPEGDHRWLGLQAREQDRWWPYRLLRARLRAPMPGGTTYSHREQRRRDRIATTRAGR